MPREKNKFLLVIIICIIILIANIGYLLYSTFNRPLFVWEYDLVYNVTDTIGFDLNKTALVFGNVIPQSTATRKITIQNMYPFSVFGKVFASEDVVGYLTSENDFTLNANETKELAFTLSIPKDHPYGEYRGKIKIKIWRDQ